MNCIITYKGQKYSEEQFKEYFINNKQEFATSIARNKDVIDSFKRKMEGIDFVFSQSPELASIGSKAQYLQYLSTIFKTSQVKDIVYHGSKNKNEVFNNGFSKEKVRKDEESGKSLFEFTTSKIYAKQHGGVIPILLNAKSDNIQEQAILSNGAKAIVYDDYFTVDNTISKGDMEFGISKKEMQERGIYYTVFEPEQIHILSSKKDIEGFREFVNNPNQNISLYSEDTINLSDFSIKVLGRTAENKDDKIILDIMRRMPRHEGKITFRIGQQIKTINDWPANQSDRMRYIKENLLPIYKQINKDAIPQLLEIMRTGITPNTLDEKSLFSVDAVAKFGLAIMREGLTSMYTIQEFKYKYPEFSSLSDDLFGANTFIVVNSSNVNKEKEDLLDVSIIDISMDKYQYINNKNKKTLLSHIGVKNLPEFIRNRTERNAKQLTMGLIAMKLKEIKPTLNIKRAGSLYFVKNNYYINNNIQYSYVDIDKVVPVIKSLKNNEAFIEMLPGELKQTVTNEGLYNLDYKLNLIQAVENHMLNDLNHLNINSPTLDNHIAILQNWKLNKGNAALLQMLKARLKIIQYLANKKSIDINNDPEYRDISQLISQIENSGTERSPFKKSWKGDLYFGSAFSIHNNAAQDFQVQLERANTAMSYRYIQYNERLATILNKLKKIEGRPSDVVEDKAWSIGARLSDKLMIYSDDHPDFYIKDKNGNVVMDNGKPIRRWTGLMYTKNDKYAKHKGISSDLLEVGSELNEMFKDIAREHYRHKIIQSGGRKGETIEQSIETDLKTNWRDGMVPIIKSSISEKIQKGQVFGALKDFVTRGKQPNDWRDEFYDQIVDNEDRVNSLFEKQISGSYEVRDQLLGYEYEDDHLVWPSKPQSDKTSKNLEMIMQVFVADMLLKTIGESEIIPAFQNATISLQEEMIRNNIVDDVEKTSDYKAIEVRKNAALGQHVPILGDETKGAKVIDNGIYMLMSYTAMSKTAFSIPIAITSLTSNFTMGMAHMLANQLSGMPYLAPTPEQFLKAMTLASTTEREKCEMLMNHYMVWDRDLNTMLHNTNFKSLNSSIVTMKTMNLPNWLTDYSVRKWMFIGQMLADGTYDAHSVKDGKIVYDPTKDERINNYETDPKQNAYMRGLINDITSNSAMREEQLKSKLPTRAYSGEDIINIRSQTSKWIIGAYGKGEVAAGESYTSIKIMTQFKKFLTTVVENRISSYNENKIMSTRKVKEVSPGVFEPFRESIKTEGAYRTTLRLLLKETPIVGDIMKKLKFVKESEEMLSRRKWSELKDWEKYNIIRTALDAAVFLIMYGLYIGISALGDDDDKEQAKDKSRIKRAFTDGILTTIALSPWEVKDMVSGGRTPIPLLSTVTSMLDIVTFSSQDGPIQKDIDNLLLFNGTKATVKEVNNLIFVDEIN